MRVRVRVRVRDSKLGPARPLRAPHGAGALVRLEQRDGALGVHGDGQQAVLGREDACAHVGRLAGELGGVPLVGLAHAQVLLEGLDALDGAAVDEDGEVGAVQAAMVATQQVMLLLRVRVRARARVRLRV